MGNFTEPGQRGQHGGLSPTSCFYPGKGPAGNHKIEAQRPRSATVRSQIPSSGSPSLPPPSETGLSSVLSLLDPGPESKAFPDTVSTDMRCPFLPNSPGAYLERPPPLIRISTPPPERGGSRGPGRGRGSLLPPLSLRNQQLGRSVVLGGLPRPE